MSFFQILKGLFRLLVFLPVTIFLVLIFLVFKTLFKPLNLNYPVFLIRKSWSILILRLFGLKLKVIGKQSYNATIFVSNHISWTDILVIQSVLDIIFVAKSDVKKMPGLGFLASIANTVFIDRNPQKISKDSFILRKEIEKGKLVCFFPEGTSTDGLRVLKFKPGFFQLLFDNIYNKNTSNSIILNNTNNFNEDTYINSFSKVVCSVKFTVPFKNETALPPLLTSVMFHFASWRRHHKNRGTFIDL